MGTVFAEMSSRAALTRHLGIRKIFNTKYIYKQICLEFYHTMILILYNSKGKSKLKQKFLIVLCCTTLNMHFSQSVLKFKNLHHKDPRRFAFHIFGLKNCLHPYMPC